RRGEDPTGDRRAPEHGPVRARRPAHGADPPDRRRPQRLSPRKIGPDHRHGIGSAKPSNRVPGCRQDLGYSGRAELMQAILLLSLAAAALYGASDFFGGLFSRHLPYKIVGLCGQSAVATGAIAVALISRSPLPGGATLLWGAGAGIGAAV